MIEFNCPVNICSSSGLTRNRARSATFATSSIVNDMGLSVLQRNPFERIGCLLPGRAALQRPQANDASLPDSAGAFKVRPPRFARTQRRRAFDDGGYPIL